ncbi:MAG TPA: hypothetical protein VHL77_08585 [Ferruginibacter sp.]|nr:hypothetical protein [Ferruginibacter sp.]
MLRNGIFAVCSVSIYLLVYCSLLQVEPVAGFCMLLFSPALLCWMVYTVLKDDNEPIADLGVEEFGYQDKVKAELGIF